MSVILITGGARSGKSSHAVNLAMACPGRRFFIATAEALDDEMTARIERHRADRPSAFETIEEPLRICEVLESLSSRSGVVVIDCVTLWLSNLLGRGDGDASIFAEAERLASCAQRLAPATILVSDEVGWGIVPMDPVGRRFRDLLGWANQKIARVADQVILMVAGYPLRVK
jgi:adenosylcobinamide kinase/adenosylcobinamide-phosphate guanylyltransferase